MRNKHFGLTGLAAGGCELSCPPASTRTGRTQWGPRWDSPSFGVRWVRAGSKGLVLGSSGWILMTVGMLTAGAGSVGQPRLVWTSPG